MVALVWSCGGPLQSGDVLPDSMSVNAAIHLDMTTDHEAWDGNPALTQFGVTTAWLDGRDTLRVTSTASHSDGGHSFHPHGFRIYSLLPVDGGWQFLDKQDFPDICRFRRAYRPELPACP